MAASPCKDCKDCKGETYNPCNRCEVQICGIHSYSRTDPCSSQYCNGTATCPSCHGGNEDFTFCETCSHLHDKEMDEEADEADEEAHACADDCADDCAECAAEQDATLDLGDLEAVLDLCNEVPCASRACAECGKIDDIVEFTDCPHNAAGPCMKNCPPVTLLCRPCAIKRSQDVCETSRQEASYYSSDEEL